MNHPTMNHPAMNHPTKNNPAMNHLIQKAMEAGVFLYVEEQQLRFKLSVDEFPEGLKKEILENKEQVIDFISKHQQQHNKKVYPKIEPSSSTITRTNMSFQQQRMWFIDEFQDGDSSNYNMFSALNVIGQLNLTAAEQAIKEVINRHAVLRTTYQMSDEGTIQIIKKNFEFSITKIDLTHLTGQSQKLAVQKEIDNESMSAFDLSCELMLRATWLELGCGNGVLMFNVHHIASDGWSVGIIYKEFNQLYQLSVNGHHVSLPPLSIQYSDYAIWQREYMNETYLEKQLDFWTKHLADAPTLHNLTLDFERPIEAKFKGSSFKRTLDGSIIDTVNDIALHYQVTPFMIFHSIFTLVLSRHSNSSKIVVGTPMANRVQKELESLIGYFVNTIALYTDTNSCSTFADYLRQIRQVNFDAQENQDLPFEQLVEKLKIPRSVQHNPLVQIMFAMDTSEAGEFSIDGVEFTAVESDLEGAIFDLRLDVDMNEQGIFLYWNYDKDLFKKDTVERFSEHFENLLNSVLLEPESKLEDLSMLTSKEENYLVNDLNNIESDYNNSLLIHQYFERQVERVPDNVALVYQGRELTYQSLNAKANQLAHFLREQGVSCESIVGINLERSFDMAIVILAILKAGGGYLPLDPSYPAERLQFMLEDSGLRHLISHTNSIEQLSLGKDIVSIRLEQPEIEARIKLKPITNPDLNVEHIPSSLAYVIYTSGSTGQPKGVLQLHQNVTRLFLTTNDIFQFSENDTWCLFHSISFDFSVWELWGALIYGGKLIIPSHDCTRNPEDFLNLCYEEQVTVLNQTPSAFKSLIQSNLRSTLKLETLRYVIFGGEALQVESLTPWWTMYGDNSPQLINMYGITETTVHVTYKHIKQDMKRRSSIGKRLPDQRVYLLDQDKNVVPYGAVGELYIGGAGLARGYLNQIDLTNERFIKNPFVKSERLYRTGDLARYTTGEELEFIGRADDQVKIRGFRIELGEIEQHLLACENIDSTIVISREDEYQQNVLVAYVNLIQKKDLNEHLILKHVRESLQARLPDYMLPTTFVVVKEWPITANGKIDKPALPLPDSSNMQEEYVVPSTRTEKVLCSIWQDVLALSRVGIFDNFFTIGGDSIRALSVIAKGRKLGLDFSVKDLFVNSTVKDLAEAVDSKDTQVNVWESIPDFGILNESEKHTFVRDDIEDAYPLSALQQGMIFHNWVDENSVAYHDVFGTQLKIKWNQGAFVEALTLLAKRHPSFRTVYLMGQERPLQVIYKDIELPIEIIDLSDLNSVQQRRIVEEWMDKERESTFDFEKPLVKITIHVFNKYEFYFGLSCHHAVWDGWSVANIHTELLTCYQSILRGDKAVFHGVPLPYKYFIAEELKAIKSQSSLEFWKRELTGVTLPWWSSSQRGQAKTLEYSLTSEQSLQVISIARLLGVQEKSVFLAVHMLLMRLLGGDDDVLSSVVVHGRPEAENSEKTLGLFLNSLPFRVQSFTCSYSKLIREVEVGLLDIVEHRHYPLAEIQKGMQLDFSASLFNFIDFHILESVANEIEEEQVDGFDQTNYILDADYIRDVNNNTFSISMKVDSLAFSKSIRDKLVDYLDNVLHDLLWSNHQEIDLNSLLGNSELNRILGDFNSEKKQYPGKPCVHLRFEEIVCKYPNSVALVHQGQSYSYCEINEQANLLAHHLREQRISRNTIVGIYANRSVHFLIGMLGIMKAGGAYVPLDPVNPTQRIQSMVNNAEITCLLTESVLYEQFTQKSQFENVTTVVYLDKMETEIDQSRINNPSNINLANDLCYMIYTSGSTGEPKGALVHHAGAINHIVAEFDVLGFMDESKHLKPANFLQSAASSSDVSVWQFLAPVVSGGCTVILDEMTDMPSLVSLIQQHDVHLIETAPVVLKLMLDYVKSLDADELALPSLRWLMTIAEATPVGLIDTWFNLYPNIPIMNGYGPSEASDDVTYYIIREPLASNVATVPIGKPLPNISVYILNEQLQVQPVGVPGQICIAGVGVGPGYLNMPDRTAQSFLQNPFLNQYGDHGDRIYLTGDLGRWSSEGEIEFMGRIDNQVKVRGFRIELGEIESKLATIDFVSDAAVLIYQQNNENSIAAYLVLNDSRREIESNDVIIELRSILSESLPDYMLPSSFTFLNAMPLNAADKIDRHSLPKPDAESALSRYVAPKTSIEIVLCEIWQELLGVKQVGINDDFFLLGGHSLLIISLVEKMKNRGLQINVLTIFTSPRLGDVAANTTTQVTEIEVPKNLLDSLSLDESISINNGNDEEVEYEEYDIDGVSSENDYEDYNINDDFADSQVDLTDRHNGESNNSEKEIII